MAEEISTEESAWQSFFAKPEIQAGMIQMAINLMQPRPPGLSTMGQIGQSLASGLQLAGTAQVSKRLEKEKAQKAQRKAEKEERDFNLEVYKAGLENERLGLKTKTAASSEARRAQLLPFEEEFYQARSEAQRAKAQAAIAPKQISENDIQKQLIQFRKLAHSQAYEDNGITKTFNPEKEAQLFEAYKNEYLIAVGRLQPPPQAELFAVERPGTTLQKEKAVQRERAPVQKETESSPANVEIPVSLLNPEAGNLSVPATFLPAQFEKDTRSPQRARALISQYPDAKIKTLTPDLLGSLISEVSTLLDNPNIPEETQKGLMKLFTKLRLKRGQDANK